MYLVVHFGFFSLGRKRLQLGKRTIIETYKALRTEWPCKLKGSKISHHEADVKIQRLNTKTNSYLWNIPAFLPPLQPTHHPPCDFIAQFTCLFISPYPPSWLIGTCSWSVAADVWSPDPRKNELLYPLLALQGGNRKKFNWCLQVTEKVRRSKAS